MLLHAFVPASRANVSLEGYFCHFRKHSFATSLRQPTRFQQTSYFPSVVRKHSLAKSTKWKHSFAASPGHQNLSVWSKACVT